MGGYHEGELRVQRQAGVRGAASRVGGIVRRDVPDAAARFLEAREFVVLGVVDIDGRPWATPLTGHPGFMRVPDEQTVAIGALPHPDDPAWAVLRALAERPSFAPGTGAVHAGLVAMDFATRRRARINGRVRNAGPTGLVIATDQVYSNCQQYIQRRSLAAPRSAGAPAASAVRATCAAGLTDAQSARIRAADTFFMATANPGEGVDASHRGGRPGFVRVDGNTIAWPDYHGNAMFNSLGNIAAYPPAGLLFPDFGDGNVLQVSGRATIDWDPASAARWPGAERVVRLEVERVVERAAALPLRASDVEYSPFNPAV